MSENSKRKAKPRVGRIGSKAPVSDVPAFVALEREARERGEGDDPRRTDRLAGLSAASFAQRVFAPSRPQLDRVREALVGVDEPSEAWEILAARDLIPVPWTSANARQIVAVGARCEACGDRAEFMGHVRGCERENIPATVCAAATLASDPEGIAAAEQLALVSFERMYGDVAAAQPRVLWRVEPPDYSAPIHQRRPGHARAKSAKPGTWECFKPFIDALGARPVDRAPPRSQHWRDGLWVPEGTPRGTESYIARSAFHLLHWPWIDALHRDAVNHWSWALSVREKRPNPFTPLCEVWALGYAVEIVDDQLVVLFAPSITL